MGIMIALATVMAMQASGQESPETLVRLALEKVNRDKVVLQTLVRDKTDVTEELDSDAQPKGVVIVEPEKGNITMSLPKLLKEGRYTYRHEGFERVNGRMAIKLGFVPGTPEKQPEPEQKTGEGRIAQGVEDGLNKVLNKLQGHLWLDQDTLGIAQFEAHLSENVFHVIAWVSKTDIMYEQMYAFGIWVPSKTVTDTRIAKFLPRPRKYRRTTISFTNYRPKPPQ